MGRGLSASVSGPLVLLSVPFRSVRSSGTSAWPASPCPTTSRTGQRAPTAQASGWSTRGATGPPSSTSSGDRWRARARRGARTWSSSASTGGPTGAGGPGGRVRVDGFRRLGTLQTVRRFEGSFGWLENSLLGKGWYELWGGGGECGTDRYHESETVISNAALCESPPLTCLKTVQGTTRFALGQLCFLAPLHYAPESPHISFSGRSTK